MYDTIECLVIGAGAVGLATAKVMAEAGAEVIIVDAAGAIGTETSSRNSEVIHAGIYYPTGSVKARTCVAGRKALYRYCDDHGVSYRRCGKLIVATTAAQVQALSGIRDRARANGVDNLEWISGSEAMALEPALRCEAALVSPSTGIIDSHGLMLAYLGDAETAGAMLALNAPVLGARVVDSGLLVDVGGDTPMTLKARTVINAGGLYADRIASRIDGLAAGHVPRYRFAKGNYYRLSGRAPFSRLIYPVPENGGLGVHITIDLGGQARFGPDVEWIAHPDDYEVDPGRAERFYDAVRTYWPDLEDGALSPDYAGIRPKLQAPGEPAADFRVDGPDTHGVAGLVNLFGIESPGLTASLALAGHVRDLVDPVGHTEDETATA